jgi:hypothetical protein
VLAVRHPKACVIIKSRMLELALQQNARRAVCRGRWRARRVTLICPSSLAGLRSRTATRA